MKESLKLKIAATISAVTGCFTAIYTLRKLPDFDKDVDYTKIFKSKEDSANILGRWVLSFGVEMICISLATAATLVSFFGSKVILDHEFPTKEEEKEAVYSKPLLTEKEAREISEHWKEKDSKRAWQEKINSEASTPSQPEKGLNV